MRKESKLFWIVTTATLGWMVVMHLYSPKNIIQFELAGTVQSAYEIFSNWRIDGVAAARFSTYLDFIFLVLYCWAISLGCKVASRFSGKETLQRIGSLLSKVIWFAGFCDAIENIAMLRSLREITQLTVSVAYYFAIVKFAIVLICLLFVIASVLNGTISRILNLESRNKSSNRNP